MSSARILGLLSDSLSEGTVPGKIFSVDWDRVRKAASPSSPVTQTAVPSKPRADPYSDEPFFKRNPVSTWNACIGKQGYEEHYIDGYIEAAMELAGAVIDKKMYEKRDTLVLPILYNARHAVELALKFATDRLVEAALIQPVDAAITTLKPTGNVSTVPLWATKSSFRSYKR
jgi:hypothetical protein